MDSFTNIVYLCGGLFIICCFKWNPLMVWWIGAKAIMVVTWGYLFLAYSVLYLLGIIGQEWFGYLQGSLVWIVIFGYSYSTIIGLRWWHEDRKYKLIEKERRSKLKKAKA